MRMEQINDHLPEQFKIENILDLSEIKFTSEQEIESFYSKVRSSICSMLKRKGDRINCRTTNQVFLEDEILSPTFEEVIMLWCLEKIDPLLPSQVKKIFSQQFENKWCLTELQGDIFEVIPVLLDLDGKEGLDIAGYTDKVSTKYDIKNETTELYLEEDLKIEEVEVSNDDDSSQQKKFQMLKLKENSAAGSCVSIKDSRRRGRRKKAGKANLEEEVDSNSTRVESEGKLQEDERQQIHTFAEHQENRLNDENMTDPEIIEKNDSIAKDPKEIDFDDANNIKTVLDDAIDDDVEESANLDDKQNPPNSCSICNKTFKSEKHLGWHQRYHQVDSVPHNCKTCNKSFATKRKLNDHMMTHKIEHCVCDICDKSFDRRKHLINHRYKQHKQYNCEHCDIVTNGKQEYETHLKELHGVMVGSQSNPRKKEHPCEICGKFFHNLNYLKIHLLRHDDKLTCILCSVKFETKKLYSIHMNNLHKSSAEVTKKFPCEVCGKLFTGSHILKKHLNTHSEGWNKIKCETCSRVFSSQQQMGSHICKHFTCDDCGQKFVRMRNLEFHKREHAGETMFPCDICEALFDKKKRLGEHKRFVHKGVRRYKCDQCPKKFAVKSGLNNHVLIHSGERPHRCNECNQTFRLKSSLDIHNRMHTNELPFECDGCHQRFRMLGNLKAHRENKLCGFSEGDLFRNTVEN